MKKITLHAMVLLLTFGSSTVVFAQTNSGTEPGTKPAEQNSVQKMRELIDNKKEIKGDAVDEIKAMRKETKKAIKNIRTSNANSTEKRMRVKDLREKMASSTKKIKGKAMEKRIDNKLLHMTDRFQATVEREKAIMAKISSRMAKIKSGGGNTNDAEKMLAKAKIHFTEARTAIENLKSLIASTASPVKASSTIAISRETMTKLRQANRDAEKHLREGHNILQKIVGNLRGNSELNNTTSTKTN